MAKKLKACAISWCSALRSDGSKYCVVHAEHRQLRPLAPDEEGSTNPDTCRGCEGKGKCWKCGGDGRCGSCGGTCPECDGDKQCAECGGKGVREPYRIRA